jgi:hypothetical protein
MRATAWARRGWAPAGASAGGHVGLGAHLEGELPALGVVVDRDALHLQRADLGQAGDQAHGDVLAAAGGGGGQAGGERGQVDEVVAGELDQLARLPRAVAGRGHEVEAHRLAEAQREAALGERDLGAGFGAARQHADRARGLAALLQHQEVAACRAAADAGAQAGAPGAHEGEGHRAAGHGEIGGVVVQHARRRATPVREQLFQAGGDRVGAEYAAVEQQGVGDGVRGGGAVGGGSVCRRRSRLCRRRRLPPQAGRAPHARPWRGGAGRRRGGG